MAVPSNDSEKMVQAAQDPRNYQRRITDQAPTSEHNLNGHVIGTGDFANLRTASGGDELQQKVELNLVSELREANQNLVSATCDALDKQDEAELTMRRQEEFLSMLAHELRNPLAAVSLAVELIDTIKQDHPRLPEIHGILTRQISQVSRLVEDLMDSSRITSGKFKIKTAVLQLSEVIDCAIESSQPYLQGRHQHLTANIPTEPILMDGDFERLVQVFTNLLINATKFTAQHENIWLTAHKEGQVVKVSIRDNGIGIEPEIQPFIFDLFTQGPLPMDRSQGGLGVGLSLVSTIVTMHQGGVSMYSKGVGFGSEFTVTLPVY